MQKIIREIPQYKTVKKGVTKKTFFIASDGQEFTSEKQCEEWEGVLKTENIFKTIKQLEFDSIEFPAYWFYIENEEQLEIFKHKYSYYDKPNQSKVYVNGILKKDNELKTVFHGWIGYRSDYGGDYPDSIYFYTLEYIKYIFSVLLEKLGE